MSSLLFVFLILSAITASADVQSSKVNAYSVLAPADGVSSSKINAYSVLAPADGVSSSKINAYSVLAPADGVSNSKFVGYVVLGPSLAVTQPSEFIFTKNDRSCFEGQSATYVSTECKKPYDVLQALASTL